MKAKKTKTKHRVVNDLLRTNNSLEDWHGAFDQRADDTHPTIRRLGQNHLEGASELLTNFHRSKSVLESPWAHRQKR